MSKSHKYSIATLSLGSCEVHALPDKLRAASQAGFAAIELFTPDWQKYCDVYAEERHTVRNAALDLQAAKDLKQLTDSLNLRINCLQPIRGMDGQTDPEKRQKSFDEAYAYLPICNALDIDLFLCCSNIDKDIGTSGDVKAVSNDLVALADMCVEWQRKNGGELVRVAFEALAWGIHINTWRQAWACVNYQPRANLGLIIDSFNALGREYADPFSPSGLQRPLAQSKAFLEKHLADLKETVPGSKIFLFQIADAGLPEPSSPYSTPPTLESGIPRIQPWSRNCRLFPLETHRGAFLPVTQYTRAVLATGYSGDLSLEVFNASLRQSGAQVPIEHAQRGYASLVKLDKAISTAPSNGVGEGTHDLLANKLHQLLQPIVQQG